MSWKTIKLQNVASILSGFAFESRLFTDERKGLPIVRIRDVERGHSETFYSGPYDVKYVVSDGDFLIGMDGNFNIAPWKGGKALLNQRVCKIDQVNETFLDLKYLAYFLSRELKRIEDLTPFVTVKHLSVKTLHALEIPLPALPEQKRIAAILDKADALRAKRRAALARLDTLLQATFLDMFGDPVTNPMGWPVGRIGDLASQVNYGSSRKASERGTFPILRMGNITYNGGWDLSDLKYIDLDETERQKHLVYRGQILFNRTNSKELVGKTAVFRETDPMVFAGYLVRMITNERADPEYVSAFMNTPHTKRYLQEKCRNIVGMANINAREFQAISIPIPPVNIQQRYGAFVQKILQEKGKSHTQLEIQDSLFQSLQQRAFKGEL